MPGAAPNNASLFRPKFGAIFTAAASTSPLASLASFTPTGPGPAAWTNWGHLSRSTLPARNADGGDALTLSTWAALNAFTEPGEESLSYEYTLVQPDAATIAALSALHGQTVSLLELWYSGARRMGKWIPSASGAWTQDPMASDVDDWANMKFRFSVQSPPASLNLAGLASPSAGIAPYPTPAAPTMLIIDPSAFEAAA